MQHRIMYKWEVLRIKKQNALYKDLRQCTNSLSLGRILRDLNFCSSFGSGLRMAMPFRGAHFENYSF